jgi:Tol biopolymer transport system component
LAACADDPGAVRGHASQGLVLVRVVEGSLDLARARLADGAVIPLTETPAHDETWPYWSQSARQLVFQRSAGRGEANDLSLWDAETGAERTLTQTPRRDERWPAWAPRGSRLVHAFRGGQPAAGIVLVDVADDADDRKVIAQENGAHYFLRPSFAPDSATVVVQRRTRDAASSKLWLLAADTDPRPLTTDPTWTELKAHFTRDGARVLYSRRPAAGGPHDIASVDVDGGDLRLHASADHADNHSARPSPTRDEFVFVSDRSGNSDVYLADLAGGAPRNLTDSADRNEYAPRWSPDGELLVMIAVPADSEAPQLADRASLARSRLRVVDRQGRVLLETPGLMADWMPAW